MAKIEVEGKAYKVTENLGYQAGHHAKAVETETGERIAVKRGGVWTWWTERDRLSGGGRNAVGMSANAHAQPERGAR
jgi:hypothetical protein